jgi:hypothetical protein
VPDENRGYRELWQQAVPLPAEHSATDDQEQASDLRTHENRGHDFPRHTLRQSRRENPPRRIDREH